MALKGAEFVAEQARDYRAQAKKIPSAVNDQSMKGGIDIQNIDVLRSGNNARIQFDTAALQKLVDVGLNGLTPVFLEMKLMPTPLAAMKVQ